MKKQENYLDHIMTQDRNNGQVSLWRAVILQAFIDLSTNSEKIEDKIAKRFARSWILGMTEDFKLVCSMAEYDPYYIRRKAISIINNKKTRTTANTLHKVA